MLAHMFIYTKYKKLQNFIKYGFLSLSSANKTY